MLSITLGNSLRLCHGLLYRTQDNTFWHIFDQNRAAIFERQTLADSNRRAHDPIGYYVNMKCNVTSSA